MTEHTVTFEWLGYREVVTREVFVVGGRFLGTERVRSETYRGYDGWTWSERETTVAFEGQRGMTAWMDVPFREYHIWMAQTNGGRHLSCPVP